MDTKSMTEEQTIQIMHSMDCLQWIIDHKLQLGHGDWTLKGHEYQVKWLQEDHPRQCFIKGAQIGATETLVLRTLHGMIYGMYPQGSLYLFPTRKDVQDFSKARFAPLINDNPFIGAHVQEVDSVDVKRVGRGFLYLRGARSTKNIGGAKKSSSQLKSIPVDRIIFDEMDEIEPDMITLAEERISHSSNGEMMYLGTPTIPDYGIDRMYQTSDQRVWMVECKKCGKEASLDLEFPDSIKRRLDGTAFRCCVHCGAEVYPRHGRWEAQYPSRSKDMVGWWISQLNSVYVDPTRVLDLYEDPPYGDLSEIMNSKLGRAYIPAENRLTEQDVLACCGLEPMLNKHAGPCCMGVDVGTKLHTVIAERKTRDTLKIVKMARVDSFNDLHDLARDFNVKSAVIDLFPEKRKVVEFGRNENFSVFGCNYVETSSGNITWDEKQHVIKGNRTEICDMTHELVAMNGRLELPRRNQEVSQFAREVSSMAKVLVDDETTGQSHFRYKKLARADHYRHALNYALLASERIGTVSDSKLIGRFLNGRRRRSWMCA